MMKIKITKGRIYRKYDYPCRHDGAAYVSVSRARKLFKLCRKARQQRKAIKLCDMWKIEADESPLAGVDFEDEWTATYISRNGSLTVGCLTITWPDLVEIAKKLGLKKFD